MAKALVGEDVRVDIASIERQLAELWRAERNEDRAVTRAALWNVAAHSWNGQEQAYAAEVLARVSTAVPQRTIVIQANPAGKAEIASWLSANCHLVGERRQVCSEEISIVAAGERVHHVAPLLKALLLPDMPVAVWWVGDLPSDHHEYAETLLDPADRLIVDSSQFDGADDLELVSRIAERTVTAPADLNWARLEEWRAATATLFDPPPMRERMASIRSIRILAGVGDSFGSRTGALLYAAWLMAQSGAKAEVEVAGEGGLPGIRGIELQFNDLTRAVIRRERDGGAVVAHAESRLDSVVRPLAHATEDLIVRLLKRPEADRVYLRALKLAATLE